MLSKESDGIILMSSGEPVGQRHNFVDTYMDCPTGRDRNSETANQTLTQSSEADSCCATLISLAQETPAHSRIVPTKMCVYSLFM